MKPIPETFTRNGWEHVQLERQGNFAIYQRSKPAGLKPHFEVVRIAQNPAREQFGKRIEAAESYPTETQWGKFGFTFGDEAQARTRLSQLVSKVQEKALR